MEENENKKDEGLSKKQLLYSYALYACMVTAGLINMLGIGSSGREFVITDKGSWTVFILTILSTKVVRYCMAIGVFGIILTLFNKIVMNFHRLFTMFSSIVFATYILSLVLKLL